MRNRFDNQLLLLNRQLTDMGALCQEAIAFAVKYLTEGSSHMKAKAIEAEKQIDRKEGEIENLCMRLLMQQQPVAGDLRTVSSALKMISDMERIGDQAADIAEIAGFVTKSGAMGKIHIFDMANAASQMVTDAVESFVKKDIALAHRAIALDDKVDELFIKVKNELINAVRTGNDDAEALIDLLMIAKYFERIGDHGVNISQMVIYSITGEHEQ
jgi:phosphate transport system protein